MKTFLSLLCVALLGGLAAACAPTLTAAPTPTSETLSSPAPAQPAASVPSEDLSLIATTGRPQFLNSFARW